MDRRAVPLKRFGAGAIRPFRWYFQGESAVSVASLEEICEWLSCCEYAHDKDLFQEPDFWQHPTTLERLRRGDCEDHSLWAWRKLVELGYEAHLVSGDALLPEGEVGRHVWVVVRQDDRTFILEAVAKGGARMLLPFEEAKSSYRPHFSVDGQFRFSSYTGYLHAMREQLDRELGRKAS
jgi:hypothetical protein